MIARVAAALLLLAPAAAPAAGPRDLSAGIDARLAAAHKAAGLTPAPRAEAHQLLRRVYLDLLGRVPTADEAAAFLKDADPDKHHTLIDALLTHPESAVHWRIVVRDWLTGSLTEKVPGADEFNAYLEARLAADAPWDKIARELLEPDDADPVGRGASYFLASRLTGGDRASQLDAVTVAVSSSLFGVQMQCAKCHDHPFVKDWTQANYYGIAAFFARTTAERKGGGAAVLAEKGGAEVKYSSRKDKDVAARPRFLDNREFDPAAMKGTRRAALIAAGVNADSPYFKRSITNRVWKQLTGVGLVEPVDQIHDANPPAHPELMTWLADEFAAGGFHLRHLIAGVMHSDAYLRSSRWAAAGTRPADNAHAAAALRPLSPHQLALSLATSTGYTEVLRAKYDKQKPGTTAVAVRTRFEKEREYDTLVGRFRQDGGAFEANAAHALFLTYNPAVKGMVKTGPGSLSAAMAKLKDAEAADLAFLAVLSRPPTAAEAGRVGKHLAGTAGPQRAEACEDVVWALVTVPEFRFNH
ncbi:MAG: hypothetical protein C0501_05475 [Isosphaera sp.]|nr:hypothetical protein [Isosphaera sp.]